MSKHTILLVDDDENILKVLEARMKGAGFATMTANTAEAALELLKRRPADIVVSDVKMPGMGGEGLLKAVREEWPSVPVILLTAYGTIPDAVASIHSGAADYLTKPFDGGELLDKVKALLPAAGEAGEQDLAKVSETLWGGSAANMRAFQKLVARVAGSDVSVLIAGESGTGKELVARLLHDLSPRAKGPFVVVDCGSTQPTLLESELFGHVKGSFTHAVRDKKGLIAEADGGTLFLDEIGNISKEMQTRLLRFLQERTIRPVGGNKEASVSCRVIAASNADLPEMVREGEFREDLYYRLKVVTLAVPPLRERAEDVEILAKGFVERFAREQGREDMALDGDALAKLKAHPWPGNVRELSHVIEAGMVFAEGGVIRARDLNLEPAAAESVPKSDSLSLEDNEREAIVRALEHTGWVKSKAADALGISRRAIHYKIKKYGLGDPDGED